MSKITLIIGGARSGKSSFAHKLANEYKNVCYVATADSAQASQLNDDEMIKRIQNHRNNRPSGWQTIEVPLELGKAISNLNGKLDIVIIDCITLYITNMLLDGNKTGEDHNRIIDEIKKVCTVCRNIPPDVIMVSNEVGYGIVPDNALSREFRDVAGHANQLIAKEADSVFLVTAGIELKIK